MDDVPEEWAANPSGYHRHLLICPICKTHLERAAREKEGNKRP